MQDLTHLLPKDVKPDSEGNLPTQVMNILLNYAPIIHVHGDMVLGFSSVEELISFTQIN